MPHALAPFVPMIILGFVLIRLFRRTTRSRVLNPSRLWIAPAVLLAIAAFYVLSAVRAGAIVTPLDVAIIAATAIVGVGLGTLRAHSVKLSKHPATGAIEARLSLWGLAVVLAWIAGRYALRMSGYGPASTPFGIFTDSAIALALAAVITQAVILTRRCQALSHGTSARTQAL